MRKGTIVAHKVILAAAIPFFKTMFTGNKEEARSHRISIRSIDHNILKQLISHVYGHSLVVSEGNVEAMLLAADFLQLRHISDICSIFILDYVLDYENALGIREFLSTVGYSSEALEVEQFIERNFLPISFTEEFITLPIDKLEGLLSRNHLNVDEEDIFTAAARWIEYYPARIKVAFRVLSCVRLRLLKKDFLVNVVARHQVFLIDDSCHRLINEVKSYVLEPELCLQPLLSTAAGRRSSYPWTLFFIRRKRSAACELCEFSCLELKYKARELQMDSMEAMKIPRSFPTVAANDRKIYVVGGHPENALDTVECYDVVKDEWTMISSMKRGRFGGVAAFLHNKLYVCGGSSGLETFSSVEIYNPRSNSWEDGVSMRTSRHFAAVAVLNGYIYVMGGRNQSCIFSSVERFCIEKRSWEPVPDMHEGRYFFGATVVNDKIYVFGGLNTNGIQSHGVECFNPRYMCWTILPPMPMAGRISLAVSHNNIVFVKGIESTKIHKFNVDTAEWVPGPEIPLRFQFAFGAAIYIPPE
ncbi:hypothetical protein RB195_015951 [Necator americanus]|uniref:BTB domain-containing protein n=1 Tax=Necator americanus TaxID=51031 RepID=A0ABR1E703_NECAM